MNTRLLLVTALVALTAVFGGGLAAGALAGPAVETARPPDPAHDTDHQPTGGDGDGPPALPQAAMPGMSGPEHELPPGLSISQSGYTLVPAASTLPAGSPTSFRFTITGPDGAPLRSYQPKHDKELHLILVRSDTTGFQHVHPTCDAEGVWSVPLTVPAAGTYRVFTDFTPTATPGAPAVGSLTLGADIDVAGDYQPVPLPAPSSTTQVDGYTVTLTGAMTAGRASPLTLTVSRDGRPVTDLQPYLAAYGHLVVLRAGDLAYLHVHPDGTPGDGRTAPGPDIRFAAEAPTAGTYRMFLDFQHDGLVHTAEFTATAAPTTSGAAPTSGASAPATHDAGHGH